MKNNVKNRQFLCDDSKSVQNSSFFLYQSHEKFFLFFLEMFEFREENIFTFSVATRCKIIFENIEVDEIRGFELRNEINWIVI